VRLSDAEREVLYEQLKRHAAAGRLSIDELERRIEAVAAAATREDAAKALADLPPLSPSPPAPPPAAGARRARGHAESAAADPAWQPTPERFRDPRSRRVMRVWLDAAGGRHYVPEDD
jgi:hypothetical protein